MDLNGFDLILYVTVNSFSVMPGQVFLVWTRTKQGLMCHAQGQNPVLPKRLQPFYLESCTLPLSHCASRSVLLNVYCNKKMHIIWLRDENPNGFRDIKCFMK